VEFSHPRRTDPMRLRLRDRLYQLIGETMAAAGIDRKRAVWVDIGDGVIVLLEPNLALARVVWAVIADFCVSLAEANRQAPSNERLRLRMALHRGEVLIDDHGFVGSADRKSTR